MLEQYKINSVEDLTPELIQALIFRFKTNELSRLKRLNNYYLGQSDIINRTMSDTNKPNNRIVNPFASYITDTVNGYFMGKPVSYTSENVELLDKLQMVYDANYENSHNSKLSKSLSINGVAYELVYMNEENEVKLAYLTPEEVFMVFDDSINSKPLAAIRFYETTNYIDGGVNNHVEVYTEDNVLYYKETEDEVLQLVEVQEHFFDGVPVIYYWNNDEVTGDFEKVLPLIDAYDKNVSDTSNNLEYFSDAYLVISDSQIGIEGEEDPADTFSAMKENRLMLLENGAKAEWLIKNSDTVEAEEFKDRLKEDIHNFSQVPNLSDESFGNAASGESLKYKLFGLENQVATKERLFAKSLEVRTKFIVNILNIKGGSYDHTDVVANFQRNIPVNMSYAADMVQKLSGTVSKQTLLSQLPFVTDAQFELALMEQEKQGTLYENLGEGV